ncbi:3-oxoacyl-ACP synthase [Lysinibacillus contaminans]|uniref:3-oxoacyl-ACP synthase n=1 Tax=Lysinibacillus contaminans TaxID=1293441 RepID=A0ABR5JYU1_9BACI|nr:ketoacyl-ACP synthase III [Lysinibacillus contaminans]KOS67620.1 3-oxoacyl-ACP synthase [Lysinibacillus contaminans]
MRNVIIKEMAIYHPEEKVSNDFYIEHFKQKDNEDYTKFLTEVLGRNNRYIAGKEENSLTMAIEASKRVLAKAGVSAEDLDMIMFSSQVPEYTLPTNSIMIHQALGAGGKTAVYDTNANCSGMTMALDNASRYLESHPRMNRILLVGSDNFLRISNPKDVITYANFGDVAVAVLLEKTEGEGGLIDSDYFTDSSIFDKVVFPRNGLSKGMEDNSIDYTTWLPFNGDISIERTKELIDPMLSRNNLTPEDVKAYCFSQFAKSNLDKLQAHFGVEEERVVFVSDEFGYTGTTSPLLAFYKAVEDGRIQRGDKVLLWTVGIGYHIVAVLYQY